MITKAKKKWEGELEKDQSIADAIAEPFKTPYFALFLVPVVVLGLWYLMHSLNTSGGAEWNTGLTMASNFLMLFIGLAPLYQAHTAIIGAILSGPLGKDPRQFIPEALELHLNVVLGVVFIHTLVGVTLATITFGEAEVDATANLFWNVLLLGGAAWIFSSLFKVKSTGAKQKIFGGIILGLLVFIFGNVASDYFGNPENGWVEEETFEVSLTGIVPTAEAAETAEGGVACTERRIEVMMARRTAIQVGNCPIVIYTDADRDDETPSFNGNTIILPDSTGSMPVWETVFEVVRGQGDYAQATLRLVPKPGADPERCFFYGPLPMDGESGWQFRDRILRLIPTLEKESGC